MRFDDENPSLDGTDFRMKHCTIDQIVTHDLVQKGIQGRTTASRLDIPKILKILHDSQSRLSSPGKVLGQRSNSKGNIFQTALSRP